MKRIGDKMGRMQEKVSSWLESVASVATDGCKIKIGLVLFYGLTGTAMSLALAFPGEYSNLLPLLLSGGVSVLSFQKIRALVKRPPYLRSEHAGGLAAIFLGALRMWGDYPWLGILAVVALMAPALVRDWTRANSLEPDMSKRG